MKCPNCSVPYIVVERQGLEVDYCIQCHGLWFDTEELSLLEQGSGVSLQWDTPPSQEAMNPTHRPCPRCSTPMELKVLAETDTPVIDVCPKGHGAWFERFELQRLVMPRMPELPPGEGNTTGPLPPVFTFLSTLLPKGLGS